MADERDHPLSERDLDPDPGRQLRRWLDEARRAGIELPEAMTLATATLEGVPSARMVLLKDATDDGLTFVTNYESRKGGELAENPRAALVLYWHPLGRQVRVEGAAGRLPAAASDAYFAARPVGSRLSAAVSPQSSVIDSREELEVAAEVLGRAVGNDVPRPESWGRISPRPVALGVLAAPRRPASRPVPLPARREGLGRGAAGPVAVRAWLEQVEATAESDDALAVLAWLAGGDVQMDESELRGAIRRSMLLLAAGGDPHRALELDGRAVAALAGELDRPERRQQLAHGLSGLRAESEGLPVVSAALDGMAADSDLAWRAYAAGLIGEELSEEG